MTPCRFQGHKGVRERAWDRLCRAGRDPVGDPALVESMEEHMDPERLRVLKLAEEPGRDLLRGVWVDMA